MSKSKKIVAILVVMLLIVAVGVQVSATQDNPLDLPILSLNSLDNSNAVAANSMAANAQVANAMVANSIIANAQAANAQALQQPVVSTNKTTTQGNNLPQTGVTEDITVMFFIIVCATSAVYAYKKIRDYNI